MCAHHPHMCVRAYGCVVRSPGTCSQPWTRRGCGLKRKRCATCVPPRAALPVLAYGVTLPRCGAGFRDDQVLPRVRDELKEARARLTRVVSKLEVVERGDFGPELRFLPLYEQCISKAVSVGATRA